MWRKAFGSQIGRSEIFMVKDGIVLGHKVSEAGTDVDKAKIWWPGCNHLVV